MLRIDRDNVEADVSASTGSAVITWDGWTRDEPTSPCGCNERAVVVTDVEELEDDPLEVERENFLRLRGAGQQMMKPSSPSLSEEEPGSKIAGHAAVLGFGQHAHSEGADSQSARQSSELSERNESTSQTVELSPGSSVRNSADHRGAVSLALRSAKSLHALLTSTMVQ